MKPEIRGVLTGAAVDLGGSTFLGGILGPAFAAFLSSRGASQQEIYAAMYSSAFVAALTCLGLLLNALGGFVAASLIKRRHLLYGGLSALPCLVLGLFSILNPLPSYFPLWSILLGWFLCIPFGMLGGHVASRHGPVGG